MSWSNFTLEVINVAHNTPVSNGIVCARFNTSGSTIVTISGNTDFNGNFVINSTPQIEDETSCKLNAFDLDNLNETIRQTINFSDGDTIEIDITNNYNGFLFKTRTTTTDYLFSQIGRSIHLSGFTSYVRDSTTNELYVSGYTSSDMLELSGYSNSLSVKITSKPDGYASASHNYSLINIFTDYSIENGNCIKDFYHIRLPNINDTLSWNSQNKSLQNTSVNLLLYGSQNNLLASANTLTTNNISYIDFDYHGSSYASVYSIIAGRRNSRGIAKIIASKHHYLNNEKNVFVSGSSLENLYFIESGNTEEIGYIVIEREPNVCMINKDLYDYANSLSPELNLDTSVTGSSYNYFYEQEKVGASYLDFYRFWCDTIGIQPTNIMSLEDFKENFVNSIATNFVRTNYALNQTIEDQFLINSRHGYVFDRCFIPISGEPLTQNYLTFAPSNGASQAPSSYVSLNKEGNPASVDMQYRVGNGTWNSYNIGTPIYFTSSTISFRRNPLNSGITFSYDEDNYYYFSFGGETAETPSFITYGSVTSLLDGFGENDTEMGDWCFVNLFIDCDKLRNASQLELPSELSNYCYYGMFAGCTILNSVPELPATELKESCYVDMFYNCSSLSQAPELPATVLAPYCYYGIFGNCISLSQAPELPASSLTNGCYGYMFYNCVSLEEMPYLSAETLSDRCYESMFRGCSSLTITHDLPSNEIKNYACQYMFKDCVSLVTPPIFIKGGILAGRLYALNGMFENCSMLQSYPFNNSLNIAYLAALDKHCFQGMFKNCTSLKNLPLKIWCDNAKDYSFKEMFKGCTSININLGSFEITSNNLGELSGVCESMFEGCVLLSSGITTNSIKIGPDCYKNMFKNCTSLRYIKHNFSATTDGIWSTTNASGYTKDWVYGVGQNGYFNPNHDWYRYTSVFRGSDGVPNGWTLPSPL